MTPDAIRDMLDRHYRTIDSIILSRQDPVTGLLPASTAVNAHGDYTDAWVRDNVYSILGVWGLALSYRRHDPDHHRSYLLSQSVVKLMRGLLMAMMRQADRVETFKNTLDPVDALHAKYGTQTGLAVVGDDEWGHLQLDATSLFLLMIAQMTASGLRIVFTLDEVNFVQNLVHYISRTFCTPDYGIWERGNKINHGTPEINCSSVGMAKAALEALAGFNLFGNVSSQEAVIHVIPSDIARSRFTLQGLLPRESNSKETDAALLSIIGYPAYAVEDEVLVSRTRDKIIDKLAGEYGCKRFLLDGHQSTLEDASRLHYEPSELREFEDVESEWPLFFSYLLLDALLREDTEKIKYWQNKLEPLFVEQDGQLLLPELYIVPQESIEAEKASPGSQRRIPNENVPLVWAQSLYMLSALVLDGVLRPADIDPLHRRARIGHMRNTLPLVSILSENEAVKQRLLDLGLSSETLDEVKPVKIMHADLLSKIHTLLGKNSKLGLSGRPYLVTRTVTTSRLHILGGEEIIFLPYYFNPHGFYLSYDNLLLVEHFRATLKFVAMNWDQPGQPIITFLVRDDMLVGNQQSVILELLHQCNAGECDSILVKTGNLGQLLTTAAVERIDYLHDFEFDDFELNSVLKSHFKTEKTENEGFTGKKNAPLTIKQRQLLASENDKYLSNTLVNSGDPYVKAFAIKLLWQRQGSDYKIPHSSNKETASSLLNIAEKHYEIACSHHQWSIVRELADLTGKFDERLEDALMEIIIRQKRLAVGRAYSEKATFSQPQDSHAIVKRIANYCGKNSAENVLTQEIMMHLGHLIRTKPELFKHMMTLRTWYFVQLLVGQISREQSVSTGEAYELLLNEAPHVIYDKLRSVLGAFSQKVTQLADQENLHVSGITSVDAMKTNALDTAGSDDKDWAQWRLQSGMIGRLPASFYKDVWYLLQQCNGLVIGDKYSIQSRMGSELTLDSTAGERGFALRIDGLLQGIAAPDYRQLNVEVIQRLAKLFRDNPGLHIDDDLVLDVLIGHAVKIAWRKKHATENYDEHRGQAWETFYTLSPQETNWAFIKSLMFLLTT